MSDVLSAEQRKRNMSRIRAKNTRPEIYIRKLLFSRGFRFRLHRKDLPGNPDIVLPKWKVVLFVNGCFWHRHLCDSFRWPKSNERFWREKLLGNYRRDVRNVEALEACGWRIAVIWECAIKSLSTNDTMKLGDTLEEFIRSNNNRLEIPS